VLGSEVPYWSERITSPTNLELMAWPRTLAFAEIMWSAAPRDLAGLMARIERDHASRLRGMGVAVGPADRQLVSLRIAHDPQARITQLRIASGVPEIRVHMTSDGSAPTAAAPVVTDGATLSGEGVRRILAFYGAEPIGEERRVELTRHLGAGARVVTTPPADSRYPGTGPSAMTDGLVGSIEHGDGLWQGWWGPDVSFDVTLDAPVQAREVRVSFMQKIGSWIVLPKAVEFSWSGDGVSWSPGVVVGHAIPVMQPGSRLHPFVATLPASAQVKHLRIRARSAGVLPAGHPGAGQASWIFADEVVIR
jgi:hexosaminidase